MSDEEMDVFISILLPTFRATFSQLRNLVILKNKYLNQLKDNGTNN